MAGSSDIIKEFLVSLGFKIDQNSLNKFDAGVTKGTVASFKFATALAAMAVAATLVVEKVANKMDGLYWSSVRLRDGAANIQDFQLQLSKFGGTADGALNSLENLATFLRTNPAGEGLLHNLGVQTRDVNGNLRSTIAIAKDFAALPIPYWLKVKFGARFGIDEKSLQAMGRAAGEADDKVTQLYKRAGINADDAEESSKDFENKLKDLDAEWDVLAVVGESRLLPILSKFVDLVGTLAGWLLDLDKLTDGFSTKLIILTGVLWGVSVAMNAAFGVGIGRMIISLITWAAALAETLGAGGLARAILSVGLALDAIPLVALLTLISTAALLIIDNWDTVKKYLSEFFGWLRKEYNVVAKYLGLPEWADGEATVGGKHLDGSPVDQGPGNGQRDFRQDEKNLGPNSQYGSQAELTGRALAFFQKAGWTANQAAGIVANLVAESGLKAGLTGDHGAAYGVAQWHPDRQANFAKWAGHDIHDSTLAEQLAFLNYELTKGGEKKGGDLLRGTGTAAAAGAAVSRYVERPGLTSADQDREALNRARGAVGLVTDSRLSSAPAPATTVTVDARTDVKVSGSGDPQAAGRAVGREVGRRNGNLVRDLSGAVSG